MKNRPENKRFHARTSTCIWEQLEPRVMLSADLIGTINTTKLPAVLVPGDKITLPVTITNQGDALASGSVALNVYASSDQSLDTNADFLLKALIKQKISLKPGQSKIYNAFLTMPSTPGAGNYFLLADIDPGHVIAGDNPSNNLAASATALPLAYRFGNFAGRTNVQLITTDGDGSVNTFSLKGAGFGELTPHGNSFDLTLNGTTASTALTVMVKGGNGLTQLRDIVVNGSLNNITAAAMDVTGNITFIAAGNNTGTLSSLTLHDITGGDVLTVPGAGVSWTLKAHALTDVSVTSASMIKSITASGNVSGQFAAAQIGMITIKGNLTHARIFAGANFGSDGVLGGTGSAADTFGAGSILGVNITGSTSDVVIAAGLDPVDGIAFNGNDVLTGSKSAIKSLTIKGSVTNSYFLANVLPASVTLHQIKITPHPGTDTRFTIPQLTDPNATATITAAKINATAYRYTIILHNTGQTPISTFWYAWVPDIDFLPTQPANAVSPAGWTADISGGGAGNGFSIQWSTTTAPLAAGDSLATFQFDSTDTPAQVNAISAFYPGTPIGRSFVYIGAADDGQGNFDPHGKQIDVAAGIDNNSRPIVTAVLANDTGSSATDAITSDPTITGTVTDPDGVATFVAGFGDSPSFDISSNLVNGTFTLSAATLAQINGGSLPDGSYTLKLQATDALGNPSVVKTIHFTLNTAVINGLAASAQITSLQLDATHYRYTITLHNTGSTTLGTFWYGWVPGDDFLPTSPVNIVSPNNWTSSITHAGSGDGYAIMWQASNTQARLASGSGTLTFVFESSDTPAQIAGNSPTHPGIPVNRSFVYIGAAFGDPGFQFDVQSQF